MEMLRMYCNTKFKETAILRIAYYVVNYVTNYLFSCIYNQKNFWIFLALKIYPTTVATIQQAKFTPQNKLCKLCKFYRSKPSKL